MSSTKAQQSTMKEGVFKSIGSKSKVAFFKAYNTMQPKMENGLGKTKMMGEKAKGKLQDGLHTSKIKADKFICKARGQAFVSDGYEPLLDNQYL
ncbi:hypothetical protein SAMD00019534_111020 [Acytostelium subglobosum LB1]|uniref:hypothetical protein n=1 Tax=Acytostelium subglobosum LB1 TaxID=1410327 RepID=UPI000644B627|nr:hypothetical protein SAMD00019534_111020 [Acytostelium subglobosum LB1]GAM27926.1 hypothetical protein SAMD00019534_111020 [Acytostelium subglobosum LB1]|eukprot:XP_012749209.1 hypothetical protein SAMD00019534_111020 [Acytostelium subglobosum LB1]